MEQVRRTTDFLSFSRIVLLVFVSHVLLVDVVSLKAVQNLTKTLVTSLAKNRRKVHHQLNIDEGCGEDFCRVFISVQLFQTQNKRVFFQMFEETADSPIHLYTVKLLKMLKCLEISLKFFKCSFKFLKIVKISFKFFKISLNFLQMFLK